jgi:hypothetical protein
MAVEPQPPRRSPIRMRSRFSNWVFSVVAMIVIPLFPLFVEAMKNNGVVKGESYLLTSAVLAAAFGFTSEGNLFRAAYVLLFLASLGYDFRPEPAPPSGGGGVGSPATAGAASHMAAGQWPSETFGLAMGWISGHPALDLLITVGALHAIERFIWHMVQDRRFPDWLKGP